MPAVPRLFTVRSYWELTKPRLSALVTMTAVLGFHVAPGQAGALRLASVLAGTALTAGGACALNMVLEREQDSRMRRTRARPVPSGRVSVAGATVFAVLLFLFGFTVLARFCGWFPALLSLASAGTYAAVYTPLKKRGPIAIWIGAVSGALPPVIGWSAVTGEIGSGGFALFLILFGWQFPHFLALGLLYRADYGRAGFRCLPESRAQVGLQAVIGCLLLLGASLLPLPLGLLGGLYGWGAAVTGSIFLLLGIRFARRPSNDRARTLFLASITHLPLLFALMVLDRA